MFRSSFSRRWIFVLPLFLWACWGRHSEFLEREDLFSIPLGAMPEGIRNFSTSALGSAATLSFFMENGRIYLTDHVSGKLLVFSSYGDLLTVFYDQERNPPIMKAMEQEGQTTSTNKQFISWPFRKIGHVAVSQNRIFVEDVVAVPLAGYGKEKRVPPARVILVFDRKGEYLGALGQEGMGGGSFPYVHAINLAGENDLVVVCRTAEKWIVYSYSSEGRLLYRIDVTKDFLPEGSEGHASLDEIKPSYNNRWLSFKVNYYAKDNMGSRIYFLDVDTGRYEGWISLPNKMVQVGDQKVPQSYEFLGTTEKDHIILLGMGEEVGESQLMVVEKTGKVVAVRTIRMEDRTVLSRQYHLSASGIITALFVTNKGAKISWWRGDRIALP